MYATVSITKYTSIKYIDLSIPFNSRMQAIIVIQFDMQNNLIDNILCWCHLLCDDFISSIRTHTKKTSCIPMWMVKTHDGEWPHQY